MQIELQDWQGVYFYLFIFQFIFNLGKTVLQSYIGFCHTK